MNELERNQNKLLDSALLEKLSLSYEERIESHENARKLINDLCEAVEELKKK